MLKSSINKRRSLAPLLFLCLTTLTGCGKVGPYVELQEPDPEPAGPGLFTGEKGYFSAGSDSQVSDTTPESSSKAAPGNGANSGDFAEFEAYQRWKTQERYSDEYREFQQWLEYKEWKREQNTK